MGTHAGQWDAVGRLKSVDDGTTASYVYNALGQRVEKQVGSTYREYVWGAYGELGGLHDRTTMVTHFIPVGGRVLAMYKDGGTYFFHPNHLGSTSFVTNHFGDTTQKTLYYPFGQRWWSGANIQDERFASLEQRDAETGNDPTLFRMYESRLYRWLSPDPVAGDITNPQSLNRYAYVLNNAVNFADLLGLSECPPGTHPATLTQVQNILAAAEALANSPYIDYGKGRQYKNGVLIACDCINYINIAINNAGYAVPNTVSTADIAAGQGPFRSDPTAGGRVGDVALVSPPGRPPLSHAVLIASLDPLSFYGSQSSTGPARVDVNGTYWPRAFENARFYQICVPDKRARKGGGGTSASEGRWIYTGTIYYYEDSEGTVYGVYIAGQWIWWYPPKYRKVD